jgi:ABC-2 type transport system permease protein
MSVTAAIASTLPAVKRYRWPETVVGRFVARRTVRGAAFLALVFGAYTASKSIGFAAAYPTLADRAGVIPSLVHNAGLVAIVGAPYAPATMLTIPGGAGWNTGGVMVLFGSIWGLLAATKNLRGEEDSGRIELLLSGQTTMRKATANVLAGLGASLAVLFVVLAGTLILIGSDHVVNYGVTAALFFAWTVIIAIAMFMAVGALASQLMPTRARAAGLATGIFGVFFLVRAMADTTNTLWLDNVSPMGWIEQMQPLGADRAIWAVPIVLLTLVLVAAAIYLAGRRDMGAATFADHDTAKAHTGLLGSAFLASVRLTRASTISWLAGLVVGGFFMGTLTKAAAQAFDNSAGFEHVIGRLAGGGVSAIGVNSFMSVIYLMVNTVLMAYAASAISGVREEEAQGYLDNFFVGPVGRVTWMAKRVLLIFAYIVLIAFLTGTAIWAGASVQHAGATFASLWRASLNGVPAAALTLGVGVLAMGLWPRLTSFSAYLVIGWSFLIVMVSSGLNLSHWILDTSVLHHVTLAPLVPPAWMTDWNIISISVVLCIAGVLAFSRRDLANE